MIQDWTSRLREDPAIPQAHGLDEERLRHDVPVIVDALIASLQQSALPISPEVLPSIFDPFIRGELAGRRMKGVGLGLFIAKTITDAHGGSLRVRSESDRGTSFIATLPRSP